jgi:hypothetical protein
VTRGSMRKLVALLSIMSMLVLTAGMARADDLIQDPDGLLPFTNISNIRFSNCEGAGVQTQNVYLALVRGGNANNAYDDGAEVFVAVDSTSGVGISATMTSSPSTITLPNNWQSSANGTISESYVVSQVSFDPSAGASVGGNVKWSATHSSENDSANVGIGVGCDETVSPSTDGLPPDVSWTYSGTEGSSGWYTSYGDFDWTVSDDADVTLTGCEDFTVSEDTNGTATTCSATSEDGTTSVSYTLKVDTAAPSADPALNSLPNGAGWYNVAPSVTWNWSDGGSGLDGCDATSDYSEADGEDRTISGSCSDVAGNSTGSVSSPSFDLDTVAPSVSLSGALDGASYATGEAAPTCATTDDLSGVNVFAVLGITGGGANGLGTFTATCAGATDVADNEGEDDSVTYDVTSYGGASQILQPILTGSTTTWSRGKGVPVKFRLAGDEGVGFDTSGWEMWKVQIDCRTSAPTGTRLDVSDESLSTSGWRYDGPGDQYVFNADFRNNAVGSCWRMEVHLKPTDQVMVSANFKLTK